MYDVIIAGAGPVGLFLASELRLGGASVLVLEAAADRSSPLKRLPFGLRGLWPLVGRSCPDFELEDGTRVGAALRTGKALLLELSAVATLHSLNLGDGVRHVASPVAQSLGVRALLVRPDGFVAWATEDPPDVGDVTRAVEQWFGPSGSRIR